MVAPITTATPVGDQYIETIVVDLTVDDGNATTYWQRYVQSADDVYDVTSRSNLAGIESGCVHVRFFDPDNNQTVIYRSPDECNIVATPIERTDTALQEAYTRGDFSIQIEGLDVVNDLGYEIRSLYQDNGDPIPFTDFLPGNIYVDPEVGMFTFFHFPDKWDSGCSYWGFSWWDNGGLPESVLNTYPYVSLWDDETNGFGPGGTNPGGWEEQNWDNIDDPIILNTYWDTVSEAPGEEANILVAYWTQDNTDPIEPRGGGTPDADAHSNRSEVFTSPITVVTDTQLRYRSVNLLSEVEDTKTDTYVVGLRIDLQSGVNLISQPRTVTGTEATLDFAFQGVDLIQIYRLVNGLWQVYIPDSGVLNDFETLDNQHGLYVIMNTPDTFCFPYGEEPVETALTLVDKDTNQGMNAIAVPRRSLEDNSIDNLLTSRGVEFDEIHRVTNNVFETFITGRSDVLNFSPADLTPGRSFGIVTSKTQSFELPFVD